jgi:protein-S-isoprenylcysteine O-methyltransferase Ste14
MPDSPRVSSSKLLFTAVYLLVWPTALLWLSGDWRWREGWIFGVWFVSLCATCLVWLHRNDPALLAERHRRPGTGGQGRADEWIVYGIIAGFVVWIVVMPLDGRRFHWTPPVPVWLQVIGGLLLLLAGLFLLRSFTDNPYLSPLVRIQEERQHHVVSTGVYNIVRHPMYLGATCMFIGAPLLLCSAVGLLVGAALSLLLAVRIVPEERLLARELEGYDAYRRRVRYRLIPFLW